jgi:hypothetical protein
MVLMRILLLVSALALAAACTRIDQEEAPAGGPAVAAASERACEAVVVQPWRPLSGVEFTVEAISSGPDCEHAVATLAVRDLQHNVLWSEAAPSAHIMVLADAHDEAAMRAALTEWGDASNNTTMQTTSALPDWPQGSDGPVSGEFPFYVEPGYDRDSYLQLRESNVPLFCYVQGMESMGCLALQNGSLNKIGVQSFPG